MRVNALCTAYSMLLRTGGGLTELPTLRAAAIGIFYALAPGNRGDTQTSSVASQPVFLQSLLISDNPATLVDVDGYLVQF